MKSIKILGIRIDNTTYIETLLLIKKYISSRDTHQICTVNPEYIMAAQNDPELMYIINNSSINTPDGGGLLFAANYLGSNLKEKVTGIDLIYKISRLSAKFHYKIFLLGGLDNVAKKSAQTLKTKYPNLNVVGTYEGSPRIKPISKKIWSRNYTVKKSMDISSKDQLFDKENFKIIKKITKAKPDILLVAYGCPKQDKFIARYKKYLNVPVMIGVGGSFDYIAHKVARAPKWMQTLQLEWLYRLIKDPKKRFHRITTAVIKFPWAVISKKK